MAESTWIKNPLAIWTGNEYDARGGVVMQDGNILELVPKNAVPNLQYKHIFDASGLVLTPGLVNCHHHFYQTLTRAFPSALNKKLFPWLQQLYPVWAGLDEDCVRLSTRLALTELMLSGCSLASDHHYLFNADIGEAVDIQIEECEALGMRAVLTRGSMSLGQSKGGLPPDSVVQSDEVILRESERLLNKCRGKDPKFIQLALAPCSPFSVTSELMKASAVLARQYGALIHTHLCETQDENTFCLKKYGLRPVDYLESVGWLENDVWLAHGIHFNKNEIKRLGQAGVSIAHCPSSNMVLASGICPTLDLEMSGCHIGLGVDGSASNDCSNLMQEVRQAFMLQRLKYGAEAVSHEDALRWATSGGAALFKRTDLGQLAVGNAADIAFYDLEEMRFSGHGDPIAALVLCGAHRVKHLLINGDWKVKNYEVPNLDMEKLQFDHRAAAAKLAKKFVSNHSKTNPIL